MRCPKCQVAMYEGDTECKYCGTSIDEPTPEKPTSTKSASKTTASFPKKPQTSQPQGKRPFSCCFGFFIFLSICVIVIGFFAYSIITSEELPNIISDFVNDFQPTSFFRSLDSDFDINRDLTLGEYASNGSYSSFTVKRGTTAYNSLGTFHESEIKRKYSMLKEWDDIEFEIDEVFLSDALKIQDYTYYKLKYRLNGQVFREEVVAAKLVSAGKIEYVYIAAVNDTITEDIIEMYIQQEQENAGD